MKLHFTGYEVVALYDTGSVGMGLGVSLIGEDVCSLWCHKIGRSITPDMRPFMTHCGRTNIKHCREKKVVNLILGSELVQQEKQTRQMIVVLWFNGAYASFLRKDELILAPKKRYSRMQTWPMH